MSLINWDVFKGLPGSASGNFENLCRGIIQQQYGRYGQFRKLRDQATRTLYWFGRGDPAALFQMALESLDINDPYVPERMLAAAYGVAMAHQKSKTIPDFAEKILPNFARKLFGLMFSEGASRSTTHALMRDYASHIIHLTLLHHRRFLTVGDKTRVRSPFPGAPRRGWGTVGQSYEGGYPRLPDFPPSDVMNWQYTGNKLHPTQKPVTLMQTLIDVFSTPGDLVLDPFCGSGSTLIAARDIGRRSTGIEIDPKFAAVARRRLAG